MSGVAHADTVPFGGFILAGQANLTPTGISFTNPQTLTAGTSVYNALVGSSVNLSGVSIGTPGTPWFTLSNGVNFVFHSFNPTNLPVCAIGQFNNGTPCSLFYASSPFQVQQEATGLVFVGLEGTGDAYSSSPAGGLSLVNFGLNAFLSGNVDDVIAAASSPQGLPIVENPFVFNVVEGQAPALAPEPSTFALLGTGLLSLVRLRRRA